MVLERVEPGPVGLLREPDPDVVPLVQVHQALDVVRVLVDPALDDPLEVLLERGPGDLHQDPERVLPALGEVADVGADDPDRAVLDRFGRHDADELPFRPDAGPAELEVHLLLPDPLPLVREADVDRDALDHGDASRPNASVISARQAGQARFGSENEACGSYPGESETVTRSAGPCRRPERRVHSSA